MGNKKFTNIFRLVLMLMLVAGLPVLTKLVSQNQENRSKATGSGAYGSACTSNSDCASNYCVNNGNILKNEKGEYDQMFSNASVCSSLGTDDACTSLGGSCNMAVADQFPAIGDECTTTSGLSGQVVANLCSATPSRRCCVPSDRCEGNNLITMGYDTGTNEVMTSTKSCPGGCTKSGDNFICDETVTVTPTFAPTVAPTSVPTSVVTTAPTAAPTVVSSSTSPKLSFKIAFEGVTSNVECLDNFKTVAITVGKIGTDIKQDLTVNVSKVSGLTNTAGYQVFGADNIALNSSFAGATNVYVRVKGQVHLKMYYCVSGQTKYSTSQVCSVAINGTTNNFYEYSMLAGDVDKDGAVTVLDFGEIKNSLFETGCDINSDLNGDGVVNDFDIKLTKESLKEKYDE